MQASHRYKASDADTSGMYYQRMTTRSSSSLFLATLLLGSTVMGLPDAADHSGHGGSGGHGGGSGGHGGGFGGHGGGFGGHGGGFHRHGGFGGHGRGYGYPMDLPFGVPMYPPPPMPLGVPPFPLGAPMPMAPGAGFTFGGQGIAGGMQGGIPFSGQGFDGGMQGGGATFSTVQQYSNGGDDGYAGNMMMSGQPRMMNTEGGSFNGGASLEASARVLVNGQQMPSQQVFAAQGPSQVGQVMSSRYAAGSSGMGGVADARMARSGAMFNQGTEGLQIDVDGQGQGGMPPQAGPPALPMPPQPMPPQFAPSAGSSLITKGFVRKNESFQEQKSGNKQSSKEFEKVTTQA